MAITFKEEVIRCGTAHSHLQLAGGEVQAVRTHFWGVRGNSEIVSNPGVWQLSCTCWMNDAAWPATAAGYAALRAYLLSLRDRRGEHGEVTETFLQGSDTVTSAMFTKATFEGFFEAPFAGQDFSASPVIDYPGMLGGGWIVQGTLQWTLLRDDEE